MSFQILDRDRPRHVYMPGKTGSGKSTLMFWMVMQDIQNGDAVCLIEPEGDLVQTVLDHVPKERVEDVIYLDGLDAIPFDFMGWETIQERDKLADDVIVMFNRFLSSSAGDRWQAVLQWTVNTLLIARDCSFLDIYNFLAIPAMRQKILARVDPRDNPEILQFWKEQFPIFPKDAALPIITRMSKFLLTPALKGILGSSRPKLNLLDLIHHPKNRPIILVNLAALGYETRNLLGSLIVSKVQQAAMRNIPIEKRVPFRMYVDEFQDFQTSPFDRMLSQARKHKLCLTLAHQYVHQIDESIRHAIFGNVATLILFQLHESDAQCFRGELPKGGEASPESKHRKGLEEKKAKLMVEIDVLLKRYYATNPNPGAPEDNGLLRDAREKEGQVSLIEQQLKHLPLPAPGGPTADMLPQLQVGQAIFKSADGQAHLIRTPKPPEPSPVSYAETIRIRTVEKYACAPAPIPDTEKDGGKDQEPEPTSPPPHKGKAQRA